MTRIIRRKTRDK